jgi:hypothetical protein
MTSWLITCCQWSHDWQCGGPTTVAKDKKHFGLRVSFENGRVCSSLKQLQNPHLWIDVELWITHRTEPHVPSRVGFDRVHSEGACNDRPG